jgi:hypothetical protein
MRPGSASMLRSGQRKTRRFTGQLRTFVARFAPPHTLPARSSAVLRPTMQAPPAPTSPADAKFHAREKMMCCGAFSIVRLDRAPTPTARGTSAAGVKPPALPCLCALPHRRSTPFRCRCFAGRRGRRATMKRVALAPPTFTPSSTPARGPARLSHPGARLASGFIDARVIKSKSYKVPVRAVRNKRPETKPAPPRHLDSSSKSGAPRHKVRAVDTRARPAKGMEVRSPLRRLWKAGRGAPAGATKPVCGAPRRPMRPRHRRGQTGPRR